MVTPGHWTHEEVTSDQPQPQPGVLLPPSWELWADGLKEVLAVDWSMISLHTWHCTVGHKADTNCMFFGGHFEYFMIALGTSLVSMNR